MHARLVMDANSTFPSCAGNETDCVSNSTEQPKCYPSFAPLAVGYVQAVITILIIVFSLGVNSMIIYLIARFKELRQRSFFLALQLIVINLVYTVLLLPTVVVGSIVHSWVFGPVMCTIIGGYNDFFFSCHFIMLIVMALDRFFAVFMPFFYDRHGNKIAIGLSITAWVFVSIRPITELALGCFRFVLTHKTCCGTGCSTPGGCAVFIPVFSWLAVLSGIIVPTTVYVVLYLKGRQLQHNIDVGLSLEEKARAAFNGRICKTFAMIVLAYVGVGLVVLIFYGWFTIAPEATLESLEFYVLQCLIGRTFSSSITIVNPIIILRNRDVRDAWAKLKCTLLNRICTPDRNHNDSVNSNKSLTD